MTCSLMWPRPFTQCVIGVYHCSSRTCLDCCGKTALPVQSTLFQVCPHQSGTQPEIHACMQVLKEGKVTPASDVYSFAILMYELWTGKHLFKGLMHSQVRLSFAFSPPSSLHVCVPHMLKCTSDICDKLWTGRHLLKGLDALPGESFALAFLPASSLRVYVLHTLIKSHPKLSMYELCTGKRRLEGVMHSQVRSAVAIASRQQLCLWHCRLR